MKNVVLAEIPTQRPAPCQLPPAPRRLLGRDEELASLGRDRLVVISGPGGVGKRSLALRWLHDRRADFPHGQLYADLGAHSVPVAPEEVLEAFLRALGVERIPVQLGRRAALFRAVTADRRIAVLLDNAASAAQVRPLLPASGTAVVTSRWRLSALEMDGARFVELGPLDPGDSVRLLESAAGRPARDRGSVDELARLCGGLPIALSVVGARLSSRPLSTEVASLRLSSILDLSYVELPDRQARVYRLCAWHPGPSFGVDVAAAMVDEPVYDVEDALEDLVEKNLIAEAGDGFRYHDLVRVHARRQAEPESALAVRRAVEWYLSRAVDASVEWLEAERANLVLALSAADAYEWPELVWRLCEPLWPLFRDGCHYADWVATHRRAVRAAAAVEETTAEMRLRTRLGAAFVNLREYDDARTVLTPVLTADDPVSRSAALSLAGRVRLAQGAAEDALSCFRTALEIREIPAPRGRGEAGIVSSTGVVRCLIGQALIALGRPKEAVAELEVAESLLTDRRERVEARTFLARACMDAGDLNRAQTLLNSAHDELRGLPCPLSDVFVQLAELAARTGDADLARDHYRSALACAADLADPEVTTIRARLVALEGHRLPQVPRPRS